jgi:hypothetical protein
LRAEVINSNNRKLGSYCSWFLAKHVVFCPLTTKANPNDSGFIPCSLRRVLEGLSIKLNFKQDHYFVIITFCAINQVYVLKALQRAVG